MHVTLSVWVLRLRRSTETLARAHISQEGDKDSNTRGSKVYKLLQRPQSSHRDQNRKLRFPTLVRPVPPSPSLSLASQSPLFGPVAPSAEEPYQHIQRIPPGRSTGACFFLRNTLANPRPVILGGRGQARSTCSRLQHIERRSSGSFGVVSDCRYRFTLYEQVQRGRLKWAVIVQQSRNQNLNVGCPTTSISHPYPSHWASFLCGTNSWDNAASESEDAMRCEGGRGRKLVRPYRFEWRVRGAQMAYILQPLRSRMSEHVISGTIDTSARAVHTWCVVVGDQ